VTDPGFRFRARIAGKKEIFQDRFLFLSAPDVEVMLSGLSSRYFASHFSLAPPSMAHALGRRAKKDLPKRAVFGPSLALRVQFCRCAPYTGG
jgi:hypothetical protein